MVAPKPKSGLQLGNWKLIRQLGSGGNAEVWLAEGGGKEVALKILMGEHGEQSERYQRLMQEVVLLRRLGSAPGVLPLLDVNLPPRSDANNTAWYAMPIALPLQDYLCDHPALEDVVTATLAYAHTLARLHSEGISHRDLKPSNLYRLDEKFLIGDFGIASFPGKPGLTEPGRKLGPLHFHAPELLQEADKSAGGPADVYSLSKTLWVLATGQRYPPPGELRVDVPSLRLSSWVIHPRAQLLDVIIEGCTKHDPNLRMTMSTFVAELEAWLDPHTIGGETEDTDKLFQRIRASFEADKRKDEEVGKLGQELESIRQQFEGVIERLRAVYQGANMAANSGVDMSRSLTAVAQGYGLPEPDLDRPPPRHLVG